MTKNTESIHIQIIVEKTAQFKRINFINLNILALVGVSRPRLCLQGSVFLFIFLTHLSVNNKKQGVVILKVYFLTLILVPLLRISS
jgi:hypothetical protein